MLVLLLVAVRVEDSVDNRIHARVGAREEEEHLLHQVAHRPRALLVECVPAREGINSDILCIERIFTYQRYIKLNGDQQMIKTITITIVIFRVRRLARPRTSMLVLRRVTGRRKKEPFIKSSSYGHLQSHHFQTTPSSSSCRSCSKWTRSRR